MIATVFTALSAISLASVLAGRPWTMLVARRSTPPERRAHPLYREANMALTLLWAAVFGLSALVAAWGGPIAAAVCAAANTGLGLLSPRLGHAYAAWRARRM